VGRRRFFGLLCALCIMSFSCETWLFLNPSRTLQPVCEGWSSGLNGKAACMMFGIPREASSMCEQARVVSLHMVISAGLQDDGSEIDCTKPIIVFDNATSFFCIYQTLATLCTKLNCGLMPWQSEERHYQRRPLHPSSFRSQGSCCPCSNRYGYR